MSLFGYMPEGREVQLLSVRGGGLSANILDYGAVLQDLRLDGHPYPLVLGLNNFSSYLDNSPYFGATVGRCGNRIRDGHLKLGGSTHRLDRNLHRRHTLHGGSGGTGRRLWDIRSVSEDRVSLGIVLEDGDMGFPGQLDATVEFALLAGGVLDIVIEAESDAVTLCNLVHHSYFNLDGSDSISDHLLCVDANSYLPVDHELIPTGEVKPVDGTRFDCRSFRPLRQVLPVDHNFCLSRCRGELRPVARLKSVASKVEMNIRTTEPGLQVYDGAHIDGELPGLSGRPMRAHAGIALEPQVWPDANHHAHFPQAVLRAGERYCQHTQFVFSIDSS